MCIRDRPNADQHVLAAFMAEGHLERHIRKVRNVYFEHRVQLIETLETLLPKELAWIEPGDQGMHFVLWLAEGIDDRKVVDLAARAGVSVRAVSPTFAPGTARPGLILGFGGFSGAQMNVAAQRLADVIVAEAQSPGRRGAVREPSTGKVGSRRRTSCN